MLRTEKQLGTYNCTLTQQMLWSHLRLPSGKWFYGGNIARKNVETTWKKEENLDKSVGMTRMSKCGQHWGTRDGLGDTEKGHGLTQGAIVAHERSRDTH